VETAAWHGAAAGLLGQSPAARRLRRELATAARSPCTVLLEGETGTGKGLAARTLHALSSRRAHPLVHVDCASLPPGLVESELFGHERGAFTGASERRPGRLERAGAGTLFLDEVGELPIPLQAKWLRVLQDREFERVGGAATLRLGARVVAATHRPLRADVETGRFRADLYYRLAVVRVHVPPLRDRPGDAAVIARRLLPRVARRLDEEPPRPEPGFFEGLGRHPWPGNLRELANALEVLVVRYPGRAVGSEELCSVLEPFAVGSCSAVAPRDRATRALERHGGNVARAARELGWSRSTLRYRMARWGVSRTASGREGGDQMDPYSSRATR